MQQQRAAAWAVRELLVCAGTVLYNTHILQVQQQLEMGTQARDAKDAAWVDAVLVARMPSSKGQRFYNHRQCCGRGAAALAVVLWC